MKLTFEIQGYTINIEETEEGVVVSAMQGDEEVEQFTLDLGGEESEDDDEKNRVALEQISSSDRLQLSAAAAAGA